MNWLQLGGSLVAILALAGIARVLRLGGGALEGPDEAKRTAEALLPGFEAQDAWTAGDGEIALVRGTRGLALVRRHGARFVARHAAVIDHAPGTGTLTLDIGAAKPAVVPLDARGEEWLGAATDTSVSPAHG